MLKYVIIIIIIVIVSLIAIINYNSNKLNMIKNVSNETLSNHETLSNNTFIIYNNENKILSIKNNKLQFIENSDDKLMIGNHNNLILIHNNLIYELGIDLQGNLITIRIPDVIFSIYKNKLMCNNFLLLNNNLRFTPNNDNLVSIKYC